MRTKTRKLEQELTDEQKRVVEAPIDQPVVVLAGPGAGKTTVIVKRYQYLVEQKSLQRIAAVTFTSRMALELVGRINAEVESLDDDIICTIHAFCNRQLRMLGEANELVDKKAFEIQVKSALASVGWRKSYQSVKWWIGEAKQAGVPPTSEEALQSFYSSRMLLLPGINLFDVDYMVGVALSVNKFLKDDGKITYFDMVNDCWQALQKDANLNKVKRRVEYVLVDEGQDTSNLAIRILRRICPNIFVVGDADQTLFRWAGADPEKNLFELSREGQLYKLSTNFRSGRTIVDAANALIKNNYRNGKEKFYKPMVTGVTDKVSALHVVENEDPYSEADWLVDRIVELDLRPKDIFVGARTNAQLAYVEQALTKKEIPFYVRGSKGFYSLAHVQDVLSYLTLAVDATNNAAFARIYNIPSMQMRDRSGQYCATRYLGRAFLDEITNAENSKLVMVETGRYSRRFSDGAFDLAYTMREIRKKLKVSATAALQYIAAFYKQQHKTMSGRIVLDVSQDNDIEDDIETLIVLSEGKTPDQILEQANKVLNAARQSNENESVVLSTVHSLKGLERETVFGIGWSEGLLPHRLSQMSVQLGQADDIQIPNLSSIEDERCIAYVLMTRAKKAVYLSYLQSYNKVELQPSRFLKEIGEKKWD